MGAGSSIIATLGLNRSGFTKGLQDSVRDADIAGKKMSDADTKSTGIRLANVGKVKKQFSELAATILSGADASEVAAQAALRLGSVVKLGIGGGLAVAGASVIYKEIAAAAKELDDLRKSFRDVMKESSSATWDSVESLNKKLENAITTSEKLKASIASSFGNFKQAVSKFSVSDIITKGEGVGPGDIKAGKEEMRAKTNEKIQGQLDTIAKKQQRIANIEQAGEIFGENTVALLKIRASMDEKIGAIKLRAAEIEKQTGVKFNLNGQIDAAKREAQILKDKENKTFEAHQSEAQANKELLAIDRERADAAVEVAKVKVASAKRVLALTPMEGKQDARNALKAANKELETEQKRLADSNRKAQLEPLAEAAQVAAQNAVTEMRNKALEQDADADADAARKQAHQEQSAADAAAIAELHTKALQAIDDEKRKRIAAILGTPQQKHDKAEQGRREKLAAELLAARARQHEIDKKGNSDFAPGGRKFIGPVRPGAFSDDLHNALTPRQQLRHLSALAPVPQNSGKDDSRMDENNRLLNDIKSRLKFNTA